MLSSQRDQHTPESIDLRRAIKLILRKWYLFPLFMVFTLAVAFVYNRYTVPTYLVTASVLIEEESDNKMPGSDEIMQGIGLRPSMQNLDNQVFILSSYTLIRETLRKLEFDIDYYRKGRILSSSYYPNQPIVVYPDTLGELPYDLEFGVTFRPPSRLRLFTETKHNPLDTTIYFGERFEYNGAVFTIAPGNDYRKTFRDHGVVYFTFRRAEDLIADYMTRMKVEPVSRDATIVSLALEGSNRLKDRDFMNMLLQEYLDNNLEKKNQESQRIIDFIDDQLVDISDSLDLTESRLQRFRSRNRVMDISAQGQQLIEQAVKLEDAKAQLMLEANYYDYLTNYLSRDTTDQETIIAPASMGIQDPLLASMVQNLMALQIEYFSGGVGEKNPIQNQLAQQIQNTKETMRETLAGIVEGNRLAIQENEQQIRQLNARAANLPETERQLLGIERKFKLNDVLYTFLLQKRAEAQIQKASNAPDNEIIDSARSSPDPIAPKTLFIYMFAFLMGLVLPTGAVFALDAFNNKITEEEELKKLTRMPIAGQIPVSENSFATEVVTNPATVSAEAFRGLRTRMQYFIKKGTSPVILVTSAMPGDGKSYISSNLAASYSVVNKKTILLGFDLRKPVLHKMFHVDNDKGLSTYLIGQHKLDDIIKVGLHENLDVIVSGPIPPNPAELIASDASRELLELLKERYDCIIVDTAPVGSVSDTYTLAEVADLSLLVVRLGKTIRNLLSISLEEIDELDFKHMSIVMNGVKASKYRYGYGGKYAVSNKTQKNNG